MESAPRRSLGGWLALLVLVASLCVVGSTEDRGRGRHIRRITAADLPVTLVNTSTEKPPTYQPTRLNITEIFNKNISKEIRATDAPNKSVLTQHGGEKNVTSSKDLNKLPEIESENNRANNAKEQSNGYSTNVVQSTTELSTTIGPTFNNTENSPKVIVGLEKTNANNVPTELNITEVVSKIADKSDSAEDNNNNNEILRTSSSTYRARRQNVTDTSRSEASNISKELNKDKTEISSSETSPKELNATEVIRPRSSTYRTKRPFGNSATTISPTNSPQEQATEIPVKNSKEVNVNEVVSTRGSSRRLRKPMVIVRKNGVLVANRTISPNETRMNCTEEDGNCELKSASNEESKEVVELVSLSNSTALNDSSVEEAIKTDSKENSVETTTLAKPVESSSARPTDGTFNNLDFSSTARMVLQEKIHEDILHHLTSTVSYAHYETDYVMDDDVDTFDSDPQSSLNNASKVSFGNYDTDNKFTPSFTTPRVDLFDETFARISEGIKQNLDDIEEKSVEFESTSEHTDDRFGSSSDNGSPFSNDGLPKNDSKVSVDYINHLDIVANDSAVGNAKRGNLQVDNGTHLGIETSYVQSKIFPEVTSTVKYLIDDVYSTTKIIPTNRDSEEENNRIKEEVDIASEIEEDEDQSLESAEDDAVTANPDTPETSGTTNGTVSLLVNRNRTRLTLASNRTYGRGRMFPSERFHINNTNNVDQRLVDGSDNKRLRSRETEDDSSSRVEDVTVTPRSRAYLLRATTPPQYRIEASSSSTRRMSTVSATGSGESTSPRSNSAIRTRLLNSRNPTQVNESRETATRNDERNDIPANTPRTRSRGEARYPGASISSLANDDFPIPPTAAAWSLVTMKEPGSRTRLSSVGSKPKTTLQLVDTEGEDSHTSGSYNKLTTIYNSIPTVSMNVTEKYSSQGVEATTQRNIYIRNESSILIPELNEVEITTVVPEIISLDSLIDENDTLSPIDVTTVIPEEFKDDSQDEDDDKLRFDTETTLPPVFEESTTISVQAGLKNKDVNDELSAVTERYVTTRAPKEDGEKMLEDEKDEELDEMITTTELPDMLGVGEIGTGVVSDEGFKGVEGESSKTRDDESQVDDKDSNPQIDDLNAAHGEMDYETATGSDIIGEGDSVMGVSTTPSTHSSLQSESADDQDVAIHATTPSSSNSITTTSSDDSTISDSTDEPVTAITEEYESFTDNIEGSNSTSDNSTSDNSTDESVGNVSTSTTTTPPITTNSVESSNTKSNSDGQYLQGGRNIPSFLRLFVETSPLEFCLSLGTFKKAVADLLTKGSGRIVNPDQVILRNFGREQCQMSDHPENTTSATGLLLPVEIHLVDEAVNFDRQLNEAFPLLWGQEDMDFPLRILKVDVVATPDEFVSSSVDNAGVIAAIAISCIGAACLLLLAVLLIVMRKRQKKFNYGMRCTPVSLDAYSLDSVSIHDSVRRKAGLRSSKRSYGNPAFDDPSAPSHPLTFAGLVAFATERGAMEDEFARIPHVTPKADELPAGSETKNRFANVLPLPETRVILASTPHEQLGDYINANYVTGPKNAANFYIACQAPLASTVTDFWRMVWEQQTKVIMMLTDFVENGVEKSADYLPPSEVLDCHRLFGDFQVTLKKREVREKYVISTLQLKNMESNTWREVTHLWYVSWPSQGVPEEPNSLIAFLIEARSYMKNRSGPSVVHCSPGTGRTGTVLACDLSIREFEHTRQVDIARCVARLRRDRAGCVQTRDQYAFIYQVLTLYATKLTGGVLDSI